VYCTGASDSAFNVDNVLQRINLCVIIINIVIYYVLLFVALEEHPATIDAEKALALLLKIIGKEFPDLL